MLSTFRKIPLYIKILLGMILGIICGFIFVKCGVTPEFISDWVTPFGDIFMRALKLIAVPLVFCSLVLGIGSLGDMASLSHLGMRTLGLYVCTTVAAVTLGVVLVLSINPGSVVDTSTRERLTVEYSSVVESSQHSSEALSESSPLQFFVDMVPENITAAFSNNSSILQVIVVALLMGIAVLMIGKERSEPFLKLAESVNSLILKIIDMIMAYAPIGVFAIMAALIVSNSGDTTLLSALGLYCLTVIIGLVTLILVFYPLLMKLLTGRSLKDFYRAVWPVQLLGFTTSSSAATLPLTMKQATEGLGISRQTAGFVLPVGVTINMDGTSLYQAVAAIFIAEVFGVDLSFVDILTIIGTTTISSIGTPGIPGGSVVVLVMVLWSVGIPAEGLALIIGMDRPLDMLRTVVNVTGDITVASIVDKWKKA
ncbi:MAG: dicarboxylate/amino acid:cation symporter [Rikenellaceae bacterium]